MEPAFFEKLLTEAGPLALVTTFFIYRDFKREEKLSIRLLEYEQFIRENLVTLIKEVIDALGHNTAALEELKRRPCLYEKKEGNEK